MGRVDETGRGDTDGENLVANRQSAHHVDDGLDDRIAIAGLCGATLLDEDFSLVADEGPGDLRSADVNSDAQHEIRV